MLEVVTKNEGWDYRSADTKEWTHGIHPYPAMMIPQIARRLIREYGSVGGTMFDPYCGTGTSLLEANLASMQAVGTDLNPLARLIAQVKTTSIDARELDEEIERFEDHMWNGRHDEYSPERHRFPNVDYWFDERVQRELALVRAFIDTIGNRKVADFFRVAFSLTVRRTSWTKNSEFKLVRVPGDRRLRNGREVFQEMMSILQANRFAMEKLSSAPKPGWATTSIHRFNTVHGIPPQVLQDCSTDVVVTSPPYGDSQTTVAYGQFSRLSSQWLGFESANRVDRSLMGGTIANRVPTFGHQELDDVIRDIGESHPKRAREVASFFADYRASISNVAQVVKHGGFACYVVGDRRVKGLRVPTAAATAAFFEMQGFENVGMFSRSIPNKRMPTMNSPTNVPGRLGKTMTSEFIIVCRKPD